MIDLNKCGIYIIKNIITNDCYIGSAKILKERWRRHKKDLRKNKHHSIFLQRAFNKYGENWFEFAVIEFCYQNELCEKENNAFKKYKPKYNICPIAYSQVGRKLSEDHKNKIRTYVLKHNIKPPILNEIKIQMLDYNTLEILNVFDSITKACIFIGKTNLFVSTLTACCRGKRKNAFGYKWKFK